MTRAPSSPHAPQPPEDRTQLARAGVEDAWSAERVEAARQVAARLLGAPITLLAQEPARLCRLEAVLSSRAVPFALATVDNVVGPSAMAWLTLDAAGAAVWADRVLGGDDLDAPVPIEAALDAMSHGALGYVVARMLAAYDAPLRLASLEASAAHAERRALGVCHAVQLGCGRSVVRVELWVPLDVGTARLLPPLPESMATHAAQLRVLLVADAGDATLSSHELAALERGDVVLLDSVTLERTHEAWRGGATLHPARGGSGNIRCALRDDSLVVTGFQPAREPTMTQARRTPSEPIPAALGALADVPVRLHLELGRFELTLHELSSLREGDVLATGLQTGQRVWLRAGDQPVAEGELVELDGEIGVRIVVTAR